MPQPDNVKALYNELKNTYELGSEEDFIKYLSDDKNREALRKELESEYDVGDIASFSNYLGFGTGQAAYEQYMAQRNGQSAPAAPTAAPKQPVKPMGAAATLPSWKTSAMPDDVRKRFEQQEAQPQQQPTQEPLQPLGPERFQKQMEMQQAVGSQMQSFNNKINAISENGKPFGKPIDALAPARQQRLQKEANDKLNESLNIATLGITQNTQPAREAWNQAGLRTQKDWRFGKLISNEASYLKNHDLDRMSEEAWNNIPADRKQTAVRNVSQVLRGQNPELSYGEALQMAERIVRAKSDQMMYDMAVEQNAPKGWLDYLTRKINDNAIGSILEGVARHKAGTIGDMQAREEATQQYANDNWFGGLVGDVAAMTLAPEMWIGGGVAGGALKGGTAIAGRAAGKAAVREGMSTLAGRMATKGLTSGVNLATFNAIGEAAGQAKHGGKIEGVDEETGRYVIGDYSLGDVGKSALHGLGLGVVTGPTGELIGNVGTKLVNRTASTAGKAAIRGSQALASTVAEGTIFVAPEILSGDITFDDWKHSVEMMAAFKLQGGLKSAKERIAELRGKRENSRQGFETRLRTMLDKSPNLALTKDEKAELERGGYKDLVELSEGYKKATPDQRKAIETRQPIYLEPNENGEIPLNRFIDLVEDKNISEAARAKMYYYVTGHGLPQHTIVGSNFTEHTDDKGNTTYNVQSFSRDNGIVTSRTFKNKKEAENELARINRQAELNGVDMGEKHYNELGDAERMKDAYDIVAEQKGISGEALRRKLNRKPEEMDETEKAWAKEVQQAYDNLPQDAYKTSDDVRKAINSEYDVDVDDVLKKERARRTEKEQEALEEYTKRLFADVMPKEGQPNGTNDATRLLEGSGYDGVQQRISDDADIMAAQQREEAKKKQFRGDGENKGALRPVKITQQNGEPREVFLTQGEIVLTDSGLVDPEKTKEVNNVGTLTGYDPATGEEVQFTPADIVEVEPMTTAEQQEQNIEANKQAYIQQQIDAATPTATTTDPKATTSATTADNQQQEPAPAKPKGEPKEFAPGMVLTVKNNVDGNGEERKVVVVDGERYRLESMVPPKYVPSESGNYVKVMDEEGNEFFLNKSIDYTITDYQEPVSEEQPTETVEPTEPPTAEVPTAEGITPQQQVTPESTPEPAPVEKADPMKAPMPMRTVTTGNGKNAKTETVPDFYAVPEEKTFDYIYNELGFTPEIADATVKANADETSKAINEHKAKEPQPMANPIAYKEAHDAWQRDLDAMNQQADYWKKVQSIRNQQLLAEAEERDKATRAERERRQKEIEASRKREEEAYQAELARRKAERDKKMEASINAMMQMSEDAAPMEQMAKEWPIEQDAEAMEIMNDLSPRTLEEVVAWMLSDTKDTENKIDPELVREHTGYGKADFRKFPFIFKKGGMSPEAFGEKVEQIARENDVVFKDNENGFSALLNVLGEVGGLGDLKNYIKENHRKLAEKVHSDRLREDVARKADDKSMQQNSGMNDKQQDNYMASMEQAVESGVTMMTDEETEALFSDDAVDPFESKEENQKTNSNDTRTETNDEGGDQRGAEKGGADESEAGQAGVAADDKRGDSQLEGEPQPAEQPAGGVAEEPESKTEVKAPNNDEVKGQEATEEPKKTELKVTFGFDTNSSLGRDILPLIKKWQDTFINIMHRRRGYAKQNNKFNSLGEKNGWERYRDADLYAVFDSNGNLIDFADSPRGAYDIALNSDVESFYVVRQQPTEDGYQYNGTTGWLFTNDIPESEWRDNQGKLREEVKAAATRSIEEALPTVMQPKQQKTGGNATKTSERDRRLLEVVMDKLRNIIGDRLHTTLTEDEKGLINWANAKTKGTAPVFYSNAERAVDGIKQEKATAEQWLAMIQKAGGLKAGEDKWMGLSEWLNDHKGKSLTKQEVMDFIRDNQIRMEEVNYGDAGRYWDYNHFDYQHPRSILRGYDAYVETLPNEEYAAYLNGERLGTYWDSNSAHDAITEKLGLRPINDTRLKYTTDFLDNKREIAFVIPNVESWNEGDNVHFGDAGEGRAVMWVRFGETTDKDGKKVLVIDEIQSNRHQEGREKGYKKASDAEEAKRLLDASVKAQDEYDAYMTQMSRKYGVSAMDVYSIMSGEEQKEADRLEQAVYEADDAYQNFNPSGIPDAPFEKNWHEVAMKRMLRYAAENGYDKVAWTTGEQQAQRYSLAKAITRVEKMGTADANEYSMQQKGGHWIDFATNDEGIVTESEMPELKGHHLREIFGKDVAEGIMSMKEPGEEWPIDDTTVGGEGMKGFYDQILPRFMDKYGKKWGVKTTDVELPNIGDNGLTMHSVEVTPEMKKSVLEGQPMFFRTPSGEVYGFTVGGNIYVDMDIAKADTPIHEYGHLWVPMVRESDPEMWEDIKSVLTKDKDVKPFMDIVRQRYPELTAEGREDDFMEEVFTHFSGDNGLKMLEEAAREYEEKDGQGFISKAKAIAALNKVKEALDKFWGKVAQLFGIKFRNAREVANKMFKDFMDEVDPTKVRTEQNAQRDKEYIEAVEKGDTEAEQKMVDDAAKKAGYTIEGYHGTTHLFNIFDRSKGNAEGNWGKGFYFTNNEDDAEANYSTSEGPDLNNRIELMAEQMEWQDGYEDMDYEQRKEEARKILDGGENRIISAALRMENPLVIGTHAELPETFFDFDEKYNEETDEYEGEPTGLLVDFVEAWRDVMSEPEWEHNNIDPSEILSEGYGGFTASQLEKTARELLDSQMVEDTEGNLATGEFLRQVFERMGFDGIIDSNVNFKFGTQRKVGRSMSGMDNGTIHYIAFTPNQIKQTDPVTYDDNGNVIPLSKRFNSRNADIRFQKADNKSTEREVEPYKAPKKNDGEDLIDYAKRVAKDYEEYKKRNEKPVDAGNGKGNDGNGNGNGGNVTVDKNDVPRAVARDSYERMMDSGANQFKEAVQDSMLSLKKLYEAILGKGTKIEDVEGYKNAYLAENRMHSASQAEIGMWHKDFMEPVVKAIHELTGGKRAAYDDLVKYMMAKHGLERNAVFAERDAQAAAKKGADYDDELQKNRGRDYAGLTALTGEDDVANAEGMAQKMVDDYEADHDTTELWNAINRATKQSLWKLASSGMMTPERYNEIRDMFSYYIPLQGFDETVAENVYSYMGNDGTIGYGTPIRHARGRKSLADDPIATMAMNGEAAIRQANRNEMKKRFLAFAQEHPSDLVSVSEVWLKHNDVTGEWEQVTADLNENDSPADVERKTREFDEKMEQLASNDPDHYKKASDIPNVPFRVVEPSDMKQHQVLVQRGGKKYMLTINGNPRAAQALNGLTNPDVFTEGVFGKAMNLGQWLNRQLSAFYTTRNPEFVLSNFLRDAIYSNSMSWVKESPNYALKFHKNFGKMNPVHMGKLFAQWENGKLRERIKNGTASETDQLFYDFMTNGGETGWTSLRDIEKHKKELQSSLKREGSTSRKAWKALGEAFDLMNRSVENCARFAAFVTSREMGRSIDRSISDAKEVSVNFNKKGAGDKFLTAKNQNLLGKVGASMGGLGRGLYVFFNASMQGLNNIARATKRHPGKAAGVYSTLFALGALAPILAEVLSGGDDDDDKNAYYNLPEYIRRSNICFRFGKDMPWITIPLPIEFRAIYGLGELSTGALTGKEHYTDEEFAKQYVSQLSQVLPLDFMEGGGGWHAFVPSMIKPYVEAQSNTSWTGLPIYRDNTFKPYDPEWTRAYSSANKQLVDATKWLNEATGGDDVTKGFIDWNPAKIEYMLKGYLGGYFTMYDRLQKTAETALGNRDFEWRNIPMASRVLREGDERTEARKLTNEYFDLVDEYNDTKHKVKEYEKISKSDREDAIKYAQKLAYLNNSEEYTRYLLMEYYKPILDQFHDMVKEADGEQSKRIKGEENALRRELINIIHSIDDGAEIDVDAAIDEMLMGILNDEQSDISLRKKAQNTIKKHRKAMAASQQ